MPTQSRIELEAKLKNLEGKSGIQVVVATVKSLEGSDVETYANQLFRNWRLGEAKKNNGVLLLVAPNEHKVRIEVGYGLEGTLTDALSSVIISSAIVPRFKANDFPGGIERGIDGIIILLSGDTTDWQPKPSFRAEDPPPLPNELFTILFLLIAIFVIWSLIRSARGTLPGRYAGRGGPIILLPPGGSWGPSGWGAAWAMEVAVSAGAFQVEAVGRAAVAPPEAGDDLMIEFTKADYETVSAAIREAEKHTSVQIVCVLAHSSSAYAYVPILWASALSLATPWPLIELTQLSVQRIFALQLVVFILAGFLFSWMPLRLPLVPRPIRRLRAHRAALEQFVVRRVTHTRNRCGILIFVSMAEHYTRVIADEGIVQKAHQSNGKLRSISLLSTSAMVGSRRDSLVQSNAAAQYSRCTLRPMALPTSCQIACM